MAFKTVKLETLIEDQKERIQRCRLEKGDNAILDWIIDFNKEM